MSHHKQQKNWSTVRTAEVFWSQCVDECRPVRGGSSPPRPPTLVHVFTLCVVTQALFTTKLVQSTSLIEPLDTEHGLFSRPTVGKAEPQTPSAESDSRGFKCGFCSAPAAALLVQHRDAEEEDEGEAVYTNYRSRSRSSRRTVRPPDVCEQSGSA